MWGPGGLAKSSSVWKAKDVMNRHTYAGRRRCASCYGDGSPSLPGEAGEEGRCQICIQSKQECTYNRPDFKHHKQKATAQRRDAAAAKKTSKPEELQLNSLDGPPEGNKQDDEEWETVDEQ